MPRTTEADPLTHLEAVTPSDTEAVAMGHCRGFIAAADGEVKVTTLDGDEITLPVIGGLLYPIQCTHFWATGLTCTSIVCGS